MTVLFDNQNHNVNRRVVKAFPFQAAPTDCVTCSLVPVTGELVISLPIVLSRQSLTSLLAAIIDYKLPRRSLCRNCILSNPSHFWRSSTRTSWLSNNLIYHHHHREPPSPPPSRGPNTQKLTDCDSLELLLTSYKTASYHNFFGRTNTSSKKHFKKQT